MKKRIIGFVFVFMCICTFATVSANAMTRNEAVNWVKAQEGVAYDVDGINGYQCSDFGSAYINYLIYGDPYYWKNTGGGGYTTYMGYNYYGLSYPDGWQRIENTADFVPEPGDILCFAGSSNNSAGHVAVAIEGCTISVMYGLGQNGLANNGWGEAVKYETLQYYGGWGNFQGVIRPKWSNPDPYKPEIKDFRISNATGENFTIKATLSDNVGVASAWLNVYGPNGSKGYSISASNGEFKQYIKYSDYGGYGKYSIHLYVKDSAGNEVGAALNNMYPSAGLGDSFYAVVLNAKSWKPIGVDSDNFVRLGTEDGTAKYLWKFTKHSNGTYTIKSALNGKVLDIEGMLNENGAKLQVWEDQGNSNQRWMPLEQNGGYVIYPQHTLTRVLDLDGNHTTDGTKIQLYDRNNTDAQIFAIYKGDEIYLKAPELSVENNGGTAVFDWSKVYGESAFDLHIMKNGEEYKVVNNIAENSRTYSIPLPTGSYTAYVKAKHALDSFNSNIVSFSVTNDNLIDIHTDVTSSDTKYVFISEIQNLKQAATYTVAIYSSSGELLDVQSTQIEGGTASANLIFDRPNNAAYVKVFLWDSLQSMQPLTECEKINL